MRARTILIDGSFVGAIVDDTDPLHEPAVAAYSMLVDQYQRGSVRLFAPSTVLRSYDRFVRRGALAPIETAWVARQHRNAAATVTAPSFDIAIVLVLLRRERFAAIATTLDSFDQFEIEVIRPTLNDLDDQGHGGGAISGDPTGSEIDATYPAVAYPGSPYGGDADEDDDEPDGAVSSRTAPQPAQRSTAE